MRTEAQLRRLLPRPHPGDHYRAGTVGKAMPGMEVRLAGDGEVLVRGPLVFLGYLQADGRVEPVVDGDGWLATGDIGRFDEDGLLRIVGRKKEMIITSSGKNIAPSAVESLLRAHPLIGYAVVAGDRRPYLTALLMLDEEAAPAWAAARGLAAVELKELAAEPRVLEEVAAAVARANEALSRPEQVKAYRVLDHAWSAAGVRRHGRLRTRAPPVRPPHRQLPGAAAPAGRSRHRAGVHEYGMERLLRSTVVSTVYGGTSEIQRDIIGKSYGR